VNGIEQRYFLTKKNQVKQAAICKKVKCW